MMRALSQNGRASKVRSSHPLNRSIDLLADGCAHLVVAGPTGAACAIDGSSNFVNWFELLNLLNTNGTLEVVDDSASNAPTRFYRARQ
jgi:hypothetical protein